MTRLAVLLSLLLIVTSATADPPSTKAPAAVKAAVATKAVTKAAPLPTKLVTKTVTKTATKTETKTATKVVTKAAETKIATKVVTKAPETKTEIKPPPASVPTVVTKAPASQPASAPASQKIDVPKDTAGAVSTGQRLLYELQHKNWRYVAALLLMLLIFVWRRYGEKFLALHKVPDRYLGFVTAGVAVLYALGLALGTKGPFDWSTFLSNATISGGESMLAWELGGKFALEKALGPTPAKRRRRLAACAPAPAVSPALDKVEPDKTEPDKTEPAPDTAKADTNK